MHHLFIIYIMHIICDTISNG